jgi:WD40 repeat protein
VPWPTLNGELWVFDKKFTQYIPLSIFDLQTYVGGPALYVFDCAGAGRAVYWFQRFIELREENGENPTEQLKDAIILAACGSSEQLPTDPNVPADVFTSCLTTPIKMALRWHCLNSFLYGPESLDLVDKLPGSTVTRKTPLGELNWIFTAITDAIAFDVLPTDLFLKLFRQDVLVASMFRNFLLACRVMKSSKCTPISVPALPDCTSHRLWDAWDMVVDEVLQRLPSLNAAAEYVPSSFFPHQMQELRSWLFSAGAASGVMGGPRKPPEQLPIVLQVMLSQSQRKEALELIAEFVSVLGAWAVDAVLGVDLFPYLSKLLRSNNLELRWHLVVIWQRILCADLSARQELISEKGYRCFLAILQSGSGADARELVLSLFVLAVTCVGNKEAQAACCKRNLVPLAIGLFDHEHPEVRQWAILVLAAQWAGFPEAKTQGTQLRAQEKLCLLLSDALPEVRAAAAYCIGAFVRTSVPDLVTIELNLALTLREVTSSRDCPEASALVRGQVSASLVGFAASREEHFLHLLRSAAGSSEGAAGDEDHGAVGAAVTDEERQQRRVCRAIWKHLHFLENDPQMDVARPVAQYLVQLRADPMSNSSNVSEDMGGMSIFKPADMSLLPNDYFGWCCTTFQSSSSSEEERRLEANWRRARVAQKERDALSFVASKHAKFRSKIGVVATPQTPSCLSWSAVDDTLVVGSAAGQIAFARGPAVSVIDRALNMAGGVSSFQWLQRDSSELLLAGSHETTLHVFNTVKNIQLTAWRPFVPAVGQRSPVITCWNNNQTLFTSGNVPFVRAWDLHREYAAYDLATSVNAGVTTLCDVGGNGLIAGFGSGAVKLFDPRADKEAAKDLMGFTSCTVGLSVPLTSPNSVVGVSRDGKVNIWDLRAGSTKQCSPMRSFATKAKSEVSAFALHSVAPILACGYMEQIHLYNLNGEQLRVIRYHEGFLEERIGPISALAFHPHSLVLAAASTDKYISVWSE